MQTRLTKTCTRLLILFITLFLYAGIGNLPIMPPIDSKNVAIAAPISSKQRPRAAARNRAKTQREIELVSSTSQGVTIQLVIPKSDFSFDNKPELFSSTETGTDARIPDFESPTVSFPGCRFTTELGVLRLPIQSTLIGVPADVHFQLRIVEKDFSTHKVEDLMSTSNFSVQSDTTRKKDSFLPENLVKIGEASQIRENHVLPVQLNPVQYNPIRREIRLHHRLVVEIRFSSTGTREQSTILSTIPRGLHTESTVYDAIFDDMLINPQSANRWRSPIQRAPAAPSISPTGPRYRISVTESAMYSITAQDLAAVGANLETITPATLTLTNKGKQIPIFVRGEDDQSFDPTDEIIFYGERQHGETSYIDPYSNENIYWLSWNTGRGIRMVTKTPLANANNAQTYTHFLTRAHFEKDQEFRRFRNASLTENQIYTEFSQGLQERFFTLTELPPLPNDSWFWAQLTAPASKPFSFMLPGVEATARPATVRVALHGRSNTEHDCNVWLNDKIELGEARWDGETEYQLQNQEIFQSFLNNGKNTIRITNPTSAGALIDILMLNWIQIDYWRNFKAEKDVLPFAITPLLDETGAVNPNFEVQLKNFSTPDIEIYGIDGTRYVGLSPHC